MIENGKIVKEGSAFSLFENKDEQEFIRLSGIILSIERIEAVQKMKVLIGNEIHTIEKEKSNHQIGDRVEIEAKKSRI